MPDLAIRVGETVSLSVESVDTAYTLRSEVAVALIPGANEVLVTGFSVGRTTLIVATAEEVLSYAITVDAKVSPAPEARPSSTASGRYQGYFDSQVQRVTNRLDASYSGETPMHLGILNFIGTARKSSAAEAYAFPFATLQFGSRHRLTLLDEMVYATPLTLDGTSLRGAHYDDPNFSAHVGFTSDLLLGNVIIPSDNEWAAGTSYRLDAGQVALIPSAYYINGRREYGGAAGPMGALAVVGASKDMHYTWLVELAYGNRFAAAGRANYTDAQRSGSVRILYQPLGFTSLGLNKPHGLIATFNGINRFGERWTLYADASGEDSQIPNYKSKTGFADLGVRWTFSEPLSLSAAGSASYAKREIADKSDAVSTLWVPITLSYDGMGFGASVTYRYERDSAMNAGGSGGRISGYLGFPRFTVQAYVDGQRDIATARLLLSSDPALAEAIASLGVTVSTPAELAAFLQANPQLQEAGIVQGVAFNDSPWRTQSGLTAAYRGGANFEHQLDINASVAQIGGVFSSWSAGVASALYTWRLNDVVTLQAGCSAWSNQAQIWPSFNAWAWGAGIILYSDRIGDLPDLFAASEIKGSIRQDASASGRADVSMPPLGNIKVTMDGQRETLSKSDGTYSFHDVSPGLHAVSVILPEDAELFFTTPSSASLSAGNEAHFALAPAPGKVFGYVRDDLGIPLAGVHVELSRGSDASVMATDGAGHYAFSTKPGNYEVAITDDTAPPGLQVNPERRSVYLEPFSPVQVDHTLQWQRALTGRVVATPLQPVVTLQPSGASLVPDQDGTYVFRNLKAGTYLLQVKTARSYAERQVVIPSHSGIKRTSELKLATTNAAAHRSEWSMLDETIEFPFNVVRVQPNGWTTLDAILEKVRTQQMGWRLRIEGHSDNQGSDRANRAVSYRRAAQVADYFVNVGGVSREHLDVVGLGSEFPLLPNTSMKARKKNRRIHFYLRTQP